MNSRTIFRVTLLSALFATASAFATSTISSARVDSLRIALNRVTVPEMPAKASQLVAEAQADERADVARVIVQAGLERKPAIAAALTAAIAKGSPEVAAITAVTAVLQQPGQIGQITKAAVTASPKSAGLVVAALCRQFPTKYNLIAVAASEAAPGAGKEILASVAESMTLVKPVIERALAAAGTSWNVSSIITETERFVQATALKEKTTADKLLSGITEQPVGTVALAAPTVGAPFQPVSPGTVTIGTSNTSVIAPGGGRNYSGP